jgi:hypothetical protein
MSDAVSALALSAYLLGEISHGRRAALLLRTWFLDEATRMNPNAEYAQGIPGQSTGRGIGIIDVDKPFVLAFDAARLLMSCGAASGWSARDDAALRLWVSDWLRWQTTSGNGREEASQPNNHGTAYDLLATVSAIYTGNASVANSICASAPTKRLDVQIAANGSLPMEDKRTKSEHYHTEDLFELMELASVCARTTDAPNLFAHTARDGRGLSRALEWLTPYANGTLPWPFVEIHPETFDSTLFTNIFLMAARQPVWASASSAYEATAMSPAGATSARANLVYARRAPPARQKTKKS